MISLASVEEHVAGHEDWLLALASTTPVTPPKGMVPSPADTPKITRFCITCADASNCHHIHAVSHSGTIVNNTLQLLITLTSCAGIKHNIAAKPKLIRHKTVNIYGRVASSNLAVPSHVAPIDLEGHVSLASVEEHVAGQGEVERDCTRYD